MAHIPPPPHNRSNGKQGQQGPQYEKGNTNQNSKFFVPVAFLILAIALFWGMSNSATPGQDLSFDKFLTQVQNNEFEKAEIDNTTGEIKATYRDAETTSKVLVKGPIDLSDQDRQILDSAKDLELTFETPRPSFWLSLLPFFVPILFFFGLIWMMQRRSSGQIGGIMSIGRSKAKTYSSERPGTTFEDVAGYGPVKREITEVVEFLKEPAKYAAVGARIPKGILLVGPPGTGKTLIARAVAGEAGVPFLSVSGSDFMEMFVGVGASRVRDLFESARKLGKAIIFIDEIDSIGRKRGAGLGGGHDEREQTLNQMLSEMDGFETSEGIVMMAATNRPDILDPALLRPGRFDRQVVVPLPELEDREAILEVHVRGKATAPEIDLSLIARGSPGMSGADLENLVNEAALFAVRAGEKTIQMSHFDQARDRVLMGQKRESKVLSEAEKEAIAYHEAGHAVCAAVLPTADPLHKVTIIPSGMALGVTMQLPEGERHIYRQQYIEEMLIVRMGGRVAERMIYGDISTGANDDLVRNTDLARKMVREWGMSDKVGPMAWGSQNEMFLGDELVSSKDYSDDMAHLIDEEVGRILREAEDRCTEILVKHRPGLDRVAQALLEHEAIDGDHVNRLIEGPSEPSEVLTIG